MKSNNKFESEGLIQVWAWKDAVHSGIAHLPLAEAMREIQKSAEQAAARHPELRRVTTYTNKHSYTGVR